MVDKIIYVRLFIEPYKGTNMTHEYM